jgi:hypothetical protein
MVDISVVEMEMVNLNAPKHLPSVLSVKTFRSTLGQNKNEKLNAFRQISKLLRLDKILLKSSLQLLKRNYYEIDTIICVFKSSEIGKLLNKLSKQL